jgi:hypothetical protein
MSAIAPSGTAQESADGRSFLLERVQPALSGLMDGSLSTLAPIFAVALATHRPLTGHFPVSLQQGPRSALQLAGCWPLPIAGGAHGRWPR